MLFHPANLPYWLFLGIGIALFLLAIFAGGGEEDLELEAESDFEILSWLGWGQVPLLLLLAVDFSLWGILGWFLNVAIALRTSQIPTGLMGSGGMVLLTSFLFSLGLGAWLARPLGKIFAQFGEDISNERLIGRVGTVTSAVIPYLQQGKLGQGDVMDSAGNLVTITMALPEWATMIPQRGQEILIIDRQQNIYIAIVKNSYDEAMWLNQVKRKP